MRRRERAKRPSCHSLQIKAVIGQRTTHACRIACMMWHTLGKKHTLTHTTRCFVHLKPPLWLVTEQQSIAFICLSTLQLQSNWLPLFLSCFLNFHPTSSLPSLPSCLFFLSDVESFPTALSTSYFLHTDSYLAFHLSILFSTITPLWSYRRKTKNDFAFEVLAFKLWHSSYYGLKSLDSETAALDSLAQTVLTYTFLNKYQYQPLLIFTGALKHKHTL